MPKKGIILISLALIGLIILSALVFSRERIYSFLGDGNKKSEDLAILVLGEVAPGEGGRWHEASGLADAILLVYFRAESKTVNLISLPRDLFVTFGGEQFKLNEVSRRDKINDLLVKLPEMTGIKTDKYIEIDLEMIKKAVDELGGIDVLLPAGVFDPVSGYYLAKGPHHLNGDDTVWLIRNRTAPEGDFFRERNQHLVIEAIFKRFNELDTQGRTALFFKLLPEIGKAKANFSIGELVPEAREINNIKFNSIVLGFETKLLQSTSIPWGSGAFYALVPSAGIDNYTEIKNFIQSQIK
ncbi:MAG: LCP family protein [Candidatus Colwellbacteria bacterium]|nr:LCP family protein [Candidatus Colwellbacteria bacterium]